MALKDISLAYLFGQKPERAIAYLEEKGMKISFDWHEVLDEAHNRAFTVAKSLRLDILQDLRDGVAEVMDKGLTYQDFRKNLEPTLRAKGWWGYKEVLNKATGELRMAQLGSPRRLELIYEQNVQSIYSAGRYRSQMDGVVSYPYWEYIAVMDMRTRPSHAALNGTVLRADDPAWGSFYPPIDWRCRCRVRAHDDENLKTLGLSVESSAGKIGSREQKLSDGTMATVATFRTVDPASAKPITVVTGVGFNSTPGKPWQPDPAKYDAALRKLL
jgi:SPP1 gp7 family putative phage head morphogenesis protein